MEAEDKQPEVQPELPELQVHVQDGPVVVEQVGSEVQGAGLDNWCLLYELEEGFEAKSPWERKLYRRYMPAGLDLSYKVLLLY